MADSYRPKLNFFLSNGLMIVMIAITFYTVRQTKDQVTDVGRKVDALKPGRQPVITSPTDRGSVGPNADIRGLSPFSGKIHYIVITPVEINAPWVQNNPASVATDGSFTGTAQIGQGDIGIGKQFTIKILVTSATISPGQLTAIPNDAVFSDAITVTRQ